MPKAKTYYLLFSLIPILFNCSGSAQVLPDTTNSRSGWIKTDTIKAGKFDTGKMWTFEYPPIGYFKEEYNFAPSKEWLDHVRLSALRFATYCSASFISANGLIMTNDHCARESATDVTNEGEKINDEGFYAESISEERKVPGLFVDQLVLIKDVTAEVQQSIDSVTSYEDKMKKEEEIIKTITDREEKDSGLSVHITPLYNGGRYSLYCYKRYNDVRLVFIPESQLGFFGGDDDNFTYPRFNLDCTFFRIYENDKPLETKNYFKWNNDGAKDGEPVFVVGNPGSSSRLNTVSQLEYNRDLYFPHIIEYYRNMMSIYSHLMDTKPEKKDEFNNEYLKYSNSDKAIIGYLDGLRNPVLMQKKRDFENKFRAAVNSKSDLKEKYGDLWDKIAATRKKMAGITRETDQYIINPLTSSEYFLIAQDILNIADELKYPEDQRSDDYKGTKLDSTIQALLPTDFDKEKNRTLLITQIKELYEKSGKENKFINNLTGGKEPDSAAAILLSQTILTDELKIRELVKQGPDAIYKSRDPFISFISRTEERQSELQSETNEIETREKEYNRSSGKSII